LSGEHLPGALVEESMNECQILDHEHQELLNFQFHLMFMSYQLTISSQMHFPQESMPESVISQFDQLSYLSKKN